MPQPSRYTRTAPMPRKEKHKMGEVHVKIRLTNYTDAEMAERGLLDPANIRSCEVDAIVDTGANRSAIPIGIAERLGLHVRQQGFAALADGRVVPASAAPSL